MGFLEGDSLYYPEVEAGDDIVATAANRALLVEILKKYIESLETSEYPSLESIAEFYSVWE